MAHPITAHDAKSGSPEHKRAFYIFSFMIFSLCIGGAVTLGWKISQAEKAQIERIENPEKYQSNKRLPPKSW